MPDPAGHCRALRLGFVMLRKTFFPGSQIVFHADDEGQPGRSGPALGHAASLGAGIDGA